MIPRICLTGGPCGGKSTAVKYLQARLKDYNIKPVVVPELATMMFHSGIKWKHFEPYPNLAYNFQIKMIQTQISNEDMIYSFAHIAPGLKKVLICDRGTIDNLVYSRDEWHEDILSQVGTRGFLKRRYDGIIHLDTLAYGEGYKLDNPARTENQYDAILMDQRTWDMWEAGPHIEHVRISHSVDLDTKMEQVVEQIVKWVN
jgi:thymidylate kinase